MFVDVIVFILYHPNLLLLFSINKSVFIWFQTVYNSIALLFFYRNILQIKYAVCIMCF